MVASDGTFWYTVLVLVDVSINISINQEEDSTQTLVGYVVPSNSRGVTKPRVLATPSSEA